MIDADGLQMAATDRRNATPGTSLTLVTPASLRTDVTSTCQRASGLAARQRVLQRPIDPDRGYRHRELQLLRAGAHSDSHGCGKMFPGACNSAVSDVSWRGGNSVKSVRGLCRSYAIRSVGALSLRVVRIRTVVRRKVVVCVVEWPVVSGVPRVEEFRVA